MNKILKWNFILQYGWVLTNIFNSILLLPLYLKHIDATTLGIWLATGNVLGWMTLVDPGVGEVLQQRIAEMRGRGDREETGRLIGSGYLASGIMFLAALVLGIICYLLVGRIINKNIAAYPHLSMALFVSVVATGMSLVSFSVSGMNQGLYNAASVAISSLAGNFLFLFSNLFFLYAGWGVLSIAAANLCRALFINIFNIVSMGRFLRSEQLKIIIDWLHFKKFVRIFSFTSGSKIITGISYSIDVIVLARYIPPAIITMYEINKRPINISYSLIGRHSVALMPVISHSRGSGDRQTILQLVNKQFRLYCYAALFASFLFIFNYKDLVSAWTGKGQFAGQLVVNLLVASFLLSLISYFLAIVGYALGDIKWNSVYNITRNIFFGVFMFFAAKYYGVTGTILVSILVTLFADLGFYTWRLHKLNYLDVPVVKDIFSRWLIAVPAGMLCQWGITVLLNRYIEPDLYFQRLFINGTLFTVFFVALVLVSDRSMRQMARQMVTRAIAQPLFRKAAA